MRHFILINGTMGVGKTTVCQHLKEKLDRCVFLDGDWCWDMHPFLVNNETKALVLDNISAVLNRDLTSDIFQYVLFCWVMQEEEIINAVLRRLHIDGWQVHKYSLLADAVSIEERLKKDIAAGLRTPDVLARSLARRKNYTVMDTIKIDTTAQLPEETAQWILDDLRKGELQ